MKLRAWKKMTVRFFGIYFAFYSIFCCVEADALPKTAPSQRSGPFLDRGLLHGGRSMSLSSVINMELKRSKSNKGLEALIFQFGDTLFRPRGGPPSYFQVRLSESGRELTIDFAEVRRFSLNRSDLDVRIRRSNLVTSHRWIYDPIAPSTQLILIFERPVSYRVYQKSKEPALSALIVEWKPSSNRVSQKAL